MASIPLLCNICPKRPDFSDISHLLTHVGSKGHLSHYFKAQVRSRQEPAVRQQLDIYDRWYAKYQIETLLSQRMVLKESRETKASARTSRKGAPTPLNPSIVSKKVTKAPNLRQRSTPDIKVGVIDPQLSEEPPRSPDLLAGSPPRIRDPPSGELASRHRAYIPQMRQKDSPSPSRSPLRDIFPEDPLPPLARKRYRGVDSVTDIQVTGEQSPYEMAYPDPSTLPDNVKVGAFQHPSAAVEQDPENTSTESELGKGILPIDDTGPGQSPILKGIQWPGMNIFDSASPEAQRKRNQKKTNSIMVQMELNSNAVEPLERIFWPEGSLKKERIITGMVESSPIKEDSPRPKRRRQASTRTVLGDLSTNDQSRIQRHAAATKSSSKVTTSRDADLGDLSKRTPAMLDFSPFADPLIKNSGPETINDEDMEWRLNAGNPMDRGDNFIVFRDELENELNNSMRGHDPPSDATIYPSISSTCAGTENGGLDLLHHDFTFTPSLSQNLLSFRTNGRSSTQSLSHGDYRSSTRPLSWMSMSNKENIKPGLDPKGLVDDGGMKFQPERNTQRYFYVNRAHSPEFFDFLPPQMEFGGLADSRFFGSSRNPLIPNGQRQYEPSFGTERKCPGLPVFNAVPKTHRQRGTSKNI